MKHFIAAVILAWASAPPAPPASTPACSCVPPGVPRAFEQAGAVFVGEVTGIVEPVSADDDAPLPGKFFTIKFKVEKAWKGVTSAEINILSAQGKYGCFAYPPVHKGEKYLVYADQIFHNGASRQEWLIITACNRTALIPAPEARKAAPAATAGFNREDATEDLKELEGRRSSGFRFEP